MTTDVKSEVRGKFRHIVTSGATQLAKGAVTTKEGFEDALGAVKSMPSLNSAGVALAGIAVVGTAIALKKGFDALQKHLQGNRDVRALFESDYEDHTASFFLPDVIDERDSTEKLFALFIDLLQGSSGRESTFVKYAGLRFTDNATQETHKIWGLKEECGTQVSLIDMSELPFAAAYDYAQGEDGLLNRARHGTDIFLQAKPNIFFKQLRYFAEESRKNQFLMGRFPNQTTNTLNLLRSMVMACKNILLNLQHPPDLSENDHTTVNDQEAIALCGAFEEILDHILIPLDQFVNPPDQALIADQPDEMYDLLKEIYYPKEFLSTLRSLRREVQELKEGYESKWMHTLNLGSLVAESQGILRDLSSSVISMMYLESPNTNNNHLLFLLRELSNQLDDVPGFFEKDALLDAFKDKRLPIISGLNAQYSTVIDLVGLFAAGGKKRRDKFIKAVRQIYPEMALSLTTLATHFLVPFDNLLHLEKKDASSAFFLRLIAFLVESHPPFIQETLRPNDNPSLRVQFAGLNAGLNLEGASQALTWCILDADDLGLKAETVNRFRQLLSAAYDFMDVLRIVDSLQGLLGSNKNLLLNQKVRAIVADATKALETKRVALLHSISALNQYADRDDHDSIAVRKQHLVHIITQENGLGLRFEALQDVILQAQNVLNAPGFAQGLVQDLSDQVETVFTSHAAYDASGRKYIERLLFSALREPEILALPDVRPAAPPPVIVVRPSVAVSLSSEVSEGGSEFDIMDVPPSATNLAVESAGNYAFKLNLLFTTIQAVSAFLLIMGALVLLSLTSGAAYVPIVASLTGSQIAMGTIVSGATAMAGGVGLALSSMFKPGVAADGLGGGGRSFTVMGAT
ncbi:MAG: hypothetical protein NXI01_07275 [Gammaproteobacteria bacterium]|nr:hypothetical protein [Gammaproteobacteria bacterium]